MNTEILDSVIEITKQRDTDSLEYSFVVTLAELISVDNISILRVADDNTHQYLDYILSLKITEKSHFEWLEVGLHLEKNETMYQCIAQQRNLTQVIDDHYYYYFPIVNDAQMFALVTINSTSDLTPNMTLITGFLKIYQNYLVLLRENELDKLTGLLNRKTFDSKLERLLTTQYAKIESNKPDESCWLVMIDIDHFKLVNDTYGHICGDEVLLVLSQKMKAFFGTNNLLFRFGGEEFVVVLEPMNLKRASQTLEEFRRHIASYSFPLVKQLTISMGFEKLTICDHSLTVLGHVDKALYYAKENGRNCVYHYQALITLGELSAIVDDSTAEIF